MRIFVASAVEQVFIANFESTSSHYVVSECCMGKRADYETVLENTLKLVDRPFVDFILKFVESVDSCWIFVEFVDSCWIFVDSVELLKIC